MKNVIALVVLMCSMSTFASTLDKYSSENFSSLKEQCKYGYEDSCLRRVAQTAYSNGYSSGQEQMTKKLFQVIRQLKSISEEEKQNYIDAYRKQLDEAQSSTKRYYYQTLLFILGAPRS